MDEKRLIEVDDLRVYFPLEDETVKAVEGVSWHIDKGETLAVVGESGSGKSVTAMSLMRLTDYAGGKIMSGTANFRRKNGATVDLASEKQDVMRNIRGNDISMIFQEPMTSLNPVFTVGMQIAEAIILHQGKTEEEARHGFGDAKTGSDSGAGKATYTVSASAFWWNAAAGDDCYGSKL